MHKLIVTSLLSLIASASFAQGAQLYDPMVTAPRELDTTGLQIRNTQHQSEVRSLYKHDFVQLQASPDRHKWRLFEVTAPACKKGDKNQSLCKSFAKECKEATRIAKKHKALFSCLALYHQTIFWVTDAVPEKLERTLTEKDVVEPN